MLIFLSRFICSLILLTFLFCIPFPPTGPTTIEEPIKPVTTYTNDSYEPNDSKPTATLLTGDSLTNLICIPGEYDYYKIPVDSNSQTTVLFQSKKNSNSYQYISFYLYDKNLVSLKSKSISSTDSASTTFFSRIRDTFYISIYNSSSYTPETKYSLRLQKRTVKIDDSTEPNNSKLTATFLTDTTKVAFLSTQSDTDYYRFKVATNEYMTLTVTSDSANVNSTTSSLTTKLGSTISGSTIGNVTSYTYLAKQDDTCYLKICPYSSYSSYSSSSISNSPSRYTISLLKTLFANDLYEPNDTKLTSKLILRGFHDSLKLIYSEYDYYKFAFDTTMYVEAILRPVPKSLSTSYLYMNLESISSSVLSATNNYSDSLKISYIVSAKDSMYLRINNTSSSSSIPVSLYSLELRATPISKLDSLEPNNTISTATPITAKSVQSVLFGQNDTDYYKIPLDKSEFAQITIKGDSLAGNSVYSTVQLANRSYVNGTVSTYTSLYNYYSSIKDTLVLKVFRQYSSSNAAQLKYSISVAKTTLPEDKFEPNDTKLQSKLVTIKKYDSLNCLLSDFDYYKIGLDSGMYIDAVFHLEKSLPLSSYFGVSFESIGSSISSSSTVVGDSLKLSYVSTSKDTIYIKAMFTSSNSTTVYYMPYNMEIRAKAIATIDPREPNDSRLKSVLLDSLINNSLIYGANDIDWYKIPVYANEMLETTIDSDPYSYQQLSTYLYTSTNTSITSSTVSSTSKTFSYFSSKPDTVYLNISKYASYNFLTPISYKVTLKRTKLSDDRYEENDTKLTSKTISIGKCDSLVSIPGDDDFFKIGFDTTVFLNATLKPKTLSSNLSNVYFDLEGISSTIKSGIKYSSDSIVISAIVNPKDTVYLRLRNSSTMSIAPFSYSISISAAPVVDDTFEQNDSSTTAKPIQPGLYQLRYNDPDWYSISVDSGKTIRVDIEIPASSSSLYLYLYPDYASSSALASTAVTNSSTSGFSYISPSKKTYKIALKNIYSELPQPVDYLMRIAVSN